MTPLARDDHEWTVTNSALAVEPPVDMVASGNAQMTVVVLLAAVLAAALAYGTWQLVAHRRPLLLSLVVGAGLCGFTEPLWDTLSNIWFPEIGQWTGFTAFDRDIPVWIFGAFALYWGILPYVFLRLVGTDPPRRRLATGLALLALANAAIEIPLLLMGLHHYYGPHGLKVVGLPLYWMFINGTAAFLVGVATLRMDTVLRGPRRLALPLVPPLVQPATTVALGWPFFVTVHSGSGAIGPWVASAAVIGLSLLVLHHVAPTALPPRTAPDHVTPERTTQPTQPGGRSSHDQDAR